MELPEHWVLKPNHRSKLVHFGRGTPDVAQLHDVTAGWLDEPLSRAGEWAYSQAAPVLLVEELLGMPGHPPRDFKFFVFRGLPHLVQVDSDRHVGHRRSLYAEDWLRLPIDTPFQQPTADQPKPESLGRMLLAASRLDQCFDFIRVDLYSVDGEVYFGELTAYPGGGLEPYRPRYFDHELGRYWTLPRS